MFHIFFNKLLFQLSIVCIDYFMFLPLFFLVIFFVFVTSFLIFSVKNIFKVFFFTEALLLVSVVFLSQYAVMYSYDFYLHFFFCQVILASAAAEAALFLGIFSYLYEQQFLNRIIAKRSSKNSTFFYNKKTYI